MNKPWILFSASIFTPFQILQLMFLTAERSNELKEFIAVKEFMKCEIFFRISLVRNLRERLNARGHPGSAIFCQPNHSSCQANNVEKSLAWSTRRSVRAVAVCEPDWKGFQLAEKSKFINWEMVSLQIKGTVWDRRRLDN